MKTIDYGKYIIEEEVKALKHLQDKLDDNFEKVVDAIINCGGRLVVGGIGKSADIGRKIVATMNSTGTKAAFLHAADAIHGDLGMLEEKDIVLLISKSGESEEIVNLIPYIKNLNNKIVGMVGNANSTLGKQADWVLNLGIEREACYLNLAPTNSTTCQLVMGDALAMCLMKKRGFGKADFAKFHPGGALGRKLLKTIKDIVQTQHVPKVEENAKIEDVIYMISKGRLGATAVLDDNKKVVGIVTDGDIRRVLEKGGGLSGLMAKDIMSQRPSVIFDKCLASEGLEMMKTRDINQLIVLDEGENYVGILHLHDILKEGI